jgi:hypothetical protein
LSREGRPSGRPSSPRLRRRPAVRRPRLERRPPGGGADRVLEEREGPAHVDVLPFRSALRRTRVRFAVGGHLAVAATASWRACSRPFGSAYGHPAVVRVPLGGGDDCQLTSGGVASWRWERPPTGCGQGHLAVAACAKCRSRESRSDSPVERATDTERAEHRGHRHGQAPPAGWATPANGTSPKRIHTEHGSVRVGRPRDREASVEPRIVSEHQRRFAGSTSRSSVRVDVGMT